MLFFSIGDSTRSQIAEGFLRAFAGHEFIAVTNSELSIVWLLWGWHAGNLRQIYGGKDQYWLVLFGGDDLMNGGVLGRSIVETDAGIPEAD